MAVIRTDFPTVAVSIDTFRSKVARRVVERYGPVIINDVSSGGLDPELPAAAAEWGAPYVAMHMRGTPQDMQQHIDYEGEVADEVIAWFARKLDTFRDLGLHDVILDPGFGFSKTTEQNYALLARLSDLQILERPVLAGLSRKSMIWKPLGCTPAEALNGTTALHWEALCQGASILRVHDVREAVETIRLFQCFPASGFFSSQGQKITKTTKT
jgi:dihydropteroate synthase